VAGLTWSDLQEHRPVTQKLKVDRRHIALCQTILKHSERATQDSRVTISRSFFLADIFARRISDDCRVHNKMWSIVCHTAEQIRNTQTNIGLRVTKPRK